LHIQTHILSGWCVGNLFRLTPRERMFCMLAASLQDLDGLGMVVSEELYWELHHKLGHCLLAGVLLAVVLAALSTHRVKAGLIYLALFHVHLALDYLGSGPGWPLYYLWPFSEWGLENPHAWPFFSWQNICAFVLLLAWTIGIFIRRQRTPLEVLMPSLDRKAVAALQRWRRSAEAPTS
jgi:hypothetical protein